MGVETVLSTPSIPSVAYTDGGEDPSGMSANVLGEDVTRSVRSRPRRYFPTVR